jgi:hypothetical protein
MPPVEPLLEAQNNIRIDDSKTISDNNNPSGDPLSMRHVAKAMQYEYQKLGRLINSNEFGPLMAYLN